MDVKLGLPTSTASMVHAANVRLQLPAMPGLQPLVAGKGTVVGLVAELLSVTVCALALDRVTVVEPPLKGNGFDDQTAGNCAASGGCVAVNATVTLPG